MREVRSIREPECSSTARDIPASIKDLRDPLLTTLFTAVGVASGSGLPEHGAILAWWLDSTGDSADGRNSLSLTEGGIPRSPERLSTRHGRALRHEPAAHVDAIYAASRDDYPR